MNSPQDAVKSPLAELLSIAVPTVAQMASYTVMQFIDTWILSRLGGTAPTAAANSGMMALSALSFGMGVSSVVNTLVSQSYGRKDWAKCGRYLWQGVWFAVMYAVALWPLMMLATPMFRMFGHPPEQANLEATYYRIVLLATAVKLVSMALGQFMLGINRPGAVMASAVIGVTINVIAAWMLVLGRGGFSSMGVAGAAWAQNVGVTCELLVLMVMALQPSIRKRYNVMDARLRPGYLLTLVKVGVPAGLQWLGDILAWSVFCNFIMGLLGPVAMEANTFMLRFMVVSFMPALGISSAVTALVGRYIGRGRFDVAEQRTHLAFAVTLVYMLGCGVIFFFGRHRLIALFTSDPRVLQVGALYLVFAAIYQAFDGMYIIYNGGLRGAGDTLIPAMVSATLCWTLTVGGGYVIARYFPQLGYGGPWIIATIYGAISGVYMWRRFSRGAWKAIRLGESSGSNVELSSATLART